MNVCKRWKFFIVSISKKVPKLYLFLFCLFLVISPSKVIFSVKNTPMAVMSLELSLKLEFHAMVGEETLIKFHVTNKGKIDFTGNVTLLLDDGMTNKTLTSLSAIVIARRSTLVSQRAIVFNETGHYSIWGIAEDDYGGYWSVHSWVDVYDEDLEDLELWVEQEFNVTVGNEIWIEFSVTNRGETDFTGSITLLLDNGTTNKTLFFEPTIVLDREVGLIGKESITFNESGHYSVWLIVEDGSGGYWYTYNLYEVTGTIGPDTGSSSEDATVSSSIIPGFELILTAAALLLCVPNIRRKKE